MNGKKLYRSDENKMLAGVCGGIAVYFGVDPTLIRLAWVVFSLLGGRGLLRRAAEQAAQRHGGQTARQRLGELPARQRHGSHRRLGGSSGGASRLVSRQD